MGPFVLKIWPFNEIGGEHQQEFVGPLSLGQKAALGDFLREQVGTPTIQEYYRFPRGSIFCAVQIEFLRFWAYLHTKATKSTFRPY